MEWSTSFIAFNAFILIMLVLDLLVIHKKNETVSLSQSLKWVGFWAVLALLFDVVIYYTRGQLAATEFITGYLIEWTLSVDNLFVFIVIFSYFKVPEAYQHRVLFWGILGALVLRGLFILAGVTLIQNFEWTIYIFGIVLVYTGGKMFFNNEDDEPKMENNIALRITRKLFKVTDDYKQDKFFHRENGLLYITPLFLVLVIIEFTDMVFAVDSIPAVLSITHDTFIVYTSNVFAILGLRSLYFALAGMMHVFRFLKYGLSVILVFIGVKMLISNYYHVPTTLALMFVLVVLIISVSLSLIFTKKNQESK